jgi:Flp pilus assembly pilin Flp
MTNVIRRLIREEDGMEFVEWALVAAVFALGGIGAWRALNGQIQGALGRIGADINNAR